jgi:hypothetical protein
MAGSVRVLIALCLIFCTELQQMVDRGWTDGFLLPAGQPSACLATHSAAGCFGPLSPIVHSQTPVSSKHLKQMERILAHFLSLPQWLAIARRESWAESISNSQGQKEKHLSCLA